MDKKLFLPVILGTARPGRKSENVAKYLVSYAQENLDNVETQLVDPLQFNLPKDGRGEELSDPAYTDIVKRADGFFITVPEYNHGYPGSLKRLLDSELELYIHKPVAFAGVSASPWGGTRAIEALVNVVRELGLVATFRDVNVAHVGDAFDTQGNPTEAFHTRPVESAWRELVWMATVLSWGRANVDSKYHDKA